MREDLGLREKTTEKRRQKQKKREKKERKKEKVFYDILFRNFNHSGEICERDSKQKF